MSYQNSVHFTSRNGGDDIFTPEFNNVVAGLYEEFKERIDGAREARKDMLTAALQGRMPAHLPASEATTSNWNVPKLPDELRTPGIEISGPAAVTSMLINALNPGPEGERAAGDLDDDEDSAGHSIEDTVQAARNRLGAVERTLTFYNPERQRQYEIKPGPIPFFMHRERGLHLDEPNYTVKGNPIPATILGTVATLFHAGRAQAARGQDIYFYLPKTESPEEAAIYRDMFASIQNRVPSLKDASIYGILLVESLPLVWTMEEALYALGPYAAGLNAARWDLKASILEYVMTDSSAVWPDRFGVSVAGTPFIANIFRRLIAICHKHNAVPIGGMATALPSSDDEVNLSAREAIHNDKEWEAQQGFLRAWVAHTYHMKAAADPFIKAHGNDQSLSHSATKGKPSDYPVKIERPSGDITLEGTRQNVRTLIEYLEGWLTGRGAKGIDRLSGRTGKRPALMEDLATARISVAQIAQRIIHSAKDEGSDETHTPDVVKSLIVSECEDIISRLSNNPPAEQPERYRASAKIAMRWVKNYTDRNFRSLGSYTRAELLSIAEEPSAL